MKQPLAGKRIVVTRPQAQAEMFMRRLASLGAVTIVFPTIEIARPDDFGTLDEALRTIDQYDWLIFTSVNGVDAFWQRAGELGEEPNIRARIAAIGPATAASLKAYGHAPTLVPKHYVAEGIADEIGSVDRKRMLLPRAEVVRDVLAVELKRRGAIVTEAVAYRTLAAKPEPAAMEALSEGVDVVTFTSSSTVRNFKVLIAQAHIALNNPVIACIGPVTAQTAREAGLNVQVMAETYTTDGLIEALINYYSL